jgi:UDPglucose 6-dehydrogenase
VLKRFGKNLQGKHFALWGLAFKANTDDMRKATSRDVIQDLLDAGATVTAYDPVAMKEAQHCFPNPPVIFDGRNLYDPKLVRGMGFEYLAIGR